MLSVNIATLKAKLSFYLGQVKQGVEVLVLDRSTPVAKVVPSSGTPQGLVLIEAQKSPSILKKIRIRPIKHKTDIVRLLREDRDRR